jgi:thioredoxin-like negative regulator of GroEL
MTAMEGLRFVNADELRELQRLGQPALVAFVATWNRRCQRFAADYRLLAARWPAGPTAMCVDVDESPALVSHHVVCSVPTVLWLQADQVMARWVGTDLSPVAERLQSVYGRSGG